MAKEFNLSELDCGNTILHALDPTATIFRGQDVKEFIKRLKADVMSWKCSNETMLMATQSGMNYIINKLAGDKLT